MTRKAEPSRNKLGKDFNRGLCLAVWPNQLGLWVWNVLVSDLLLHGSIFSKQAVKSQMQFFSVVGLVGVNVPVFSASSLICEAGAAGGSGCPLETLSAAVGVFHSARCVCERKLFGAADVGDFHS